MIKYEIPNSVFTILIGLFGLIIGLLYDKGGLTDLRYKNWIRKITKRGWLTILITILSILIAIIQDHLKNENDKIKDDEIVKFNKANDSILASKIRIGVDSNSKELFDIMSIAFKNEGLKLDTLNKTILKYKDSNKVTINNITQNTNPLPPYLVIDTNGVYLKSKNEIESIYNIKISSYDASSTDFKIKWMQVIIPKNKNWSVLKNRLIDRNLVLGMNSGYITEFKINSNEVEYIYIYGVGTFSSLEDDKRYKYDELYEYNVKANYTNVIIGPTKQRLLKDFHEKFNKNELQ